MTRSIFLVGETLLLLSTLNKSFPLFLFLFHSFFLIIEIDLGARVVIWVCQPLTP